VRKLRPGLFLHGRVTFNLKTSIDREQSRLKSGRLLFLGRHEESPDG
jgi:hypothetical protein